MQLRGGETNDMACSHLGTIPKLALKVVLLLAMLCVASITLTVVLERRDSRLRDETIRRGDSIVKALKAYKAHNGTYPQSMTTLTPHYIEKLPDAIWGTCRWQYRVFEDGQRFDLAVGENSEMYPCVFITSEMDSWYFDR